MTLRAKVLLAQLPMVLALLAVAAGAWWAAVRFGAAPGEILHENFRSFDAGRGMLQAVDRIDQEVFRARLHAEPVALAALEPQLAAFERELRLQEGNVTEPGEPAATAALGRAWAEYRAILGSTLARAGQVGEASELVAFQQRSRHLRGAVDDILVMNRDAMRRKSERVRREGERIAAALSAAALAALVLAVVLTGMWVRRILRPVRILERAVERMSAGDFAARIRLEGRNLESREDDSDEIAALARSFNHMADRLEQYRQSSLGELLDANNRLESVMDSLADAVVVYGLDGSPLAHNQVATRLLGGSLGLDSLPAGLEEEIRHAFERVRQTGEPQEPTSLEAAVEVAEGPAPRWILVSATPVWAQRATLGGVTVALRDVTRSRRLEGFKGDLVAAAAHELRTPLTSLHMAVHLCLERAAGPLSPRQEDLLAAARLDCERLQGVVEELLEMARLESGAARLSWERVTVAELVRDAGARHETAARQRGKRLEVVPGDGLLAVDADPGRMRLVLDNLIENALLHAGEGGRVVLGFDGAAGAVRIFVDDDGPGVAEEFRERVFAKFFRLPGTIKQGSGLGLSIVRDVVRAHGGTVGVEGSPLGGARFWVSLPAAHGAAPGSPPSSS